VCKNKKKRIKIPQKFRLDKDSVPARITLGKINAKIFFKIKL
jgi:hypothetical protein